MRIVTAGKAVVKFGKSGCRRVDQETLDARRAICRSCEHWDAGSFGGTGKCKKCGCSTWAKLRMATERCPIGKWQSVDI